MIVNPGIRRFLGSAIQRLFNSASVSLPLTHTAVPARGSIVPSFTRATTSTWQNNDGYMVTGVAGEIGFVGARRVRNLLGNTENLLGAGWTAVGAAPVQNVVDPDGGTTGWSKALGGIGEEIRCLTTYNPAGRSGLGSVYLKGTGTVSIRLSNNVDQQFVTQFTLASDWTRVSTSVNAANSTAGAWLMGIVKQPGDTATSVSIWHPQLEDVTAQTTQTAGEYVSVGALDYRSDQDPLFLSLPGTAGHYASTPDSVANSITGDIDIRVKAALTDWTPATGQTLMSKFSTTGNQRTFIFYVTTLGYLAFYGSVDGTALIDIPGTAATGFVNGSIGYCRFTRVAATGVVTFYTSTDGVTWSQLGNTGSGTTGGLFNSTSPVEIGTYQAGSSLVLNGKIYRAQIYNGIDGTLAVDFNPQRDATTPTGTFDSSTTLETWTINGASSVVRNQNYHGSGVDGVKSFDTDIAGNPISPDGYLAEGSRVNLCLQSNAFTTTWTSVSVSSLTQDQVSPSGATDAWLLVGSGAGGDRIQQDGVVINGATASYAVYLSAQGLSSSGTTLVIYDNTAGASRCACQVNNTAGVLSMGTPTGGTASIESVGGGWYRAAITTSAIVSGNSHRVYVYAGVSGGTTNQNIRIYGAQLELGSSATPYIPTTTVAVARNADVDQYPTTAGPIAAAGSIALDFTPYHAPSGTIALWGTYVDASNYTAILHDATNLIFRKRIAGSNYDATIANAFVSGTTYKVAATWGAAGTAIYLDGVAGTPHANTTAAQIAATMQVGADGNSLQQPGAGTTNLRIWQRQLSAPEGVAVTS